MDRRGDLESSVELVRRARGGEKEALERLFRRFVPPLRRWARGRLPGWARGMTDTDDMIQETLLNTFRQLEAFEPRGDGALQAYMRQALRNRIADEVRKAKRNPAPEVLHSGHRSEDASPLEQAMGHEAFERYEKALSGLGDHDREAIVARVEMGFSYEEIARALNKPSTDAARMAVGRALVRLAKGMGHEQRK